MMNKRTEIAVRPFVAALVAVVSTTVWAGVASASPPPVDVAYDLVGQHGEKGLEKPWSLTVVDDGVAELCGESTGGDGYATFTGEGRTVEVTADAELPWRLVGAVLWSSAPGEVLTELEHADFGPETARVETFGDRPVYCWGETSTLCVDERVRRIVVLEIEVGGTVWKLRSFRDGTVLQVTADGAHVARVSRGC